MIDTLQTIAIVVNAITTLFVSFAGYRRAK